MKIKMGIMLTARLSQARLSVSAFDFLREDLQIDFFTQVLILGRWQGEGGILLLDT